MPLLVIDKEAEDVLTVLEFANVELLEMRFLDQRLDDALTQAFRRFLIRSSAGGWRCSNGSSLFSDRNFHRPSVLFQRGRTLKTSQDSNNCEMCLCLHFAFT